MNNNPNRDSDKDSPSTPSRADYGPIPVFLAFLGGYDLNLVPLYSKEDEQHEKNKLVLIGSSVLIPSFFGFFTSAYFFSSYIHNVKVLLLASLTVSLVLLAIDRVIVTTLQKNKLVGTVIRICISVCLSVVVSEPALLFLYQKTIEEAIKDRLDSERETAEQKLKSKITDAKQNLTATKEQLDDNRKKLSEYSDQNIAYRRSNEADKHRKQLLDTFRKEKEGEINGKQHTVQELQGRINTKRKEVEDLSLEMDREDSGARESKKSGRGPIWDNLRLQRKDINNEITSLETEKRQLLDGIKGIRASQLNEGTYEAVIKPPSDNRNNGVLLTDDEINEKTLITNDIALLTERRDQYSKELKGLEEEVSGLKSRYAIETHNDTLAETEALYNIIRENQALMIKVGALFFLVLDIIKNHFQYRNWYPLRHGI